MSLFLALVAGKALAACTVTLVAPANGSTQTQSPTFRWTGSCRTFRLDVSPGGTFRPGDLTTFNTSTQKTYTLAEDTWDVYQAGAWAGGTSWRVRGTANDGTTTTSATRTIAMDPDYDDDGWSVAESDCDDADAAVFPGAEETCNGLDDDCNALVDENTTATEVFGGWPAPRLAFVNHDTNARFADLDGDALLDLFTCGFYEASVHRNPGGPWLSDGEVLNFSSTEVDLGDFYCRNPDFLDVSDDGDLDLVFWDDYSLWWYENDGLGGFSGGSELLSGALSSTLATGDYDGDGAVDIAVYPYVLWNEGNGTFTTDDAPCTAVGPTRPDVQAVPILADGRSLLRCGEGSWFLASASRTWTRRTGVATACEGSYPEGVPDRAADFDGDGDLDILVSNEEESGVEQGSAVSLCLGNGYGGLTFDRTVHASEGFSYVDGFADADGDGWADFAVHTFDHASQGDVTLYAGGPDGPEAVATLFLPEGYTESVGVATYQDLDGDGTPEVVGWYDDGLFEIHPDAAGDYYAPWVGGVNAHEGAAADLDGDGVLDLVAFDDPEAIVWWGIGGREFEEGETASADGPNVLELWPGGLDLDGDGDEELVLKPDLALDQWAWLDLDPSTGVVTASETVTGPYVYANHRFSGPDLDGDGDAELIVENVAAYLADGIDSETLWIGGLGEAGFPSTWVDLIDEVGQDVIFGLLAGDDFDGDGARDLVLVDQQGVRVWGWDGTALVEIASTDLTWSWSVTDFTAERRRLLSVTDADGDGDADLWLALRDEAAVQVLLNDGAGGFSFGDRLDAPAEMVDDAVALRDLAGDGVPDAWAIAGSATKITTIWRGDQTGFTSLGERELGIDEGHHRDVDGDGLADMVGAGEYRAWVYWGTTETVEVACE